MSGVPSVTSVVDATRLAIEFVSTSYIVARVVETRLEGFRWVVFLDILQFRPKYGKVRLSAITGAIQDFRAVDTRI